MILRILLHASLLLVAFASSVSLLVGQDRAASCFFSADLEAGIPAGWDIGPQVERQDPSGTGLGEFVSAWTTGDAQQANAGGFFPVPDVPAGNRFAMVNDDAFPCNCDLGDVALTTPVIDLSGRTGVGLECRVYHDQALGGGAALLEASIGGAWISLATIPAQAGAWQDLFVNLSAFDGQSELRLRFRWSDNGNWATGFAVDDICLRERLPFDVSVISVSLGDDTASPFSDPARTLAYSMMPLDQVGPFFATVTVMNRGTQTVDITGVEARVLFNGVQQQLVSIQPGGSLLPGERQRSVLPISWIPTEVGLLTVEGRIGPLTPDNDPSDNQLSADLRITGPGWENGYGAMALDGGVVQGALGGIQNFIASNRMELLNQGSTARGISAVLSGTSQVGATVRGILFDANMALVDTTMRHTLNEEDVQQAGAALPMYLPFAEPIDLSAGDYFVGFQHLNDGLPLLVSTSGNGPIGGSTLQEGTAFVLSYLHSVPMVRLHVEDFGVGIIEHAFSGISNFLLYPVPMNGRGWLEFQLETESTVAYRILDLQGRIYHEQQLGTLPSGSQRLAVDLQGAATGSYVFTLLVDGAPTSQRFLVTER